MEPWKCSGGQANVFTFSGDVFTFRANAFSFWGDVFSLAANVFSEEVARGERSVPARALS